MEKSATRRFKFPISASSGPTSSNSVRDIELAHESPVMIWNTANAPSASFLYLPVASLPSPALLSRQHSLPNTSF
eukprot:419710-Hanusia_phi.AAC.1